LKNILFWPARGEGGGAKAPSYPPLRTPMLKLLFSVPKDPESYATDFLSKRAQLSYVLEAFTLATGKLNLSTGIFASENAFIVIKHD